MSIDTPTTPRKHGRFFNRAPRFIGNGEQARERRIELEPANLRVIDAVHKRNSIAG
jgi:hypothetical protein